LRDSVWHVVATVRGAEAATAVLGLLEEAVDAVSAFETAPEEWRVEAYPSSPVLTPDLAARLALAAAAAGGTLVEIGEEKLPARDWLAENQLAFPPLRVGRFFVYGSHYRYRVPAGAIGIQVDAATAFGTGEHPSTRACLMALESLARRHRFRCPVDIGTGTGILAVAAAKLLRCRVLASDIDRGAVRVARHNVARNGVMGTVRVRRAPGYRGDLHILVEAPDGTMACSTIMWLDELNETVEFEPVGTHPGYRRRGLARAMLLHGLHLAQAAGARHATVASMGASPPARDLYYSVGFRELSRDVPLVKA